ncbi:MAG: protocadherin, partial [Planctomycetaceae bacterium]
GARGAVRGPNGGAAGHVGGARVTTPGGRTVTRGGASGAVRGPGGRTAAGRVGGGRVSGPRGSAARAGGRGLATDGGFARYRGGAAVRGPRGGVAAGHRTVAVSRGTLHGRGVAVRHGFGVRHPGYGRWFGAGWYGRYPHAWRAARWTAAGIWAATTWNNWNNWWGWPATTSAQPVYYDYGTTTVYEGDVVYQGDKQIATADEYYEQAVQIADSGQQDVTAEDAEWQSFGVFGLVQGDEEEADKVLQLGASKDGVIGGNYYDTLTDNTMPIAGSVDQKSQRVAWTVGDNSTVVYETGVGDLTKDELTVLIHFGNEKTQQWTMIRLEEPQEGE